MITDDSSNKVDVKTGFLKVAVSETSEDIERAKEEKARIGFPSFSLEERHRITLLLTEPLGENRICDWIYVKKPAQTNAELLIKKDSGSIIETVAKLRKENHGGTICYVGFIKTKLGRMEINTPYVDVAFDILHEKINNVALEAPVIALHTFAAQYRRAKEVEKEQGFTKKEKAELFQVLQIMREKGIISKWEYAQGPENGVLLIKDNSREDKNILLMMIKQTPGNHPVSYDINLPRENTHMPKTFNFGTALHILRTELEKMAEAKLKEAAQPSRIIHLRLA